MARQVHHGLLDLRIDAVERDRLAERDERAAAIADRVAHQLGDLAAERLLAALHPLPRDHVILEHEVVGDRDRHQLQARDAAHRGTR